MQIKKTFSRTQSQAIQVLNTEPIQKNPAQVSELTLSHLFRTRQRIPVALQSALRSKISQEKSNRPENQESKMKQSKIASMVKSGVKSLIRSRKDIKICQICDGEIAKPRNKTLEVYMCDCQHKQSFCESCLHHYVIYKVKTFEEVHCPHEGCPAILDVNTNFFKQLPLDIQKGYKKLNQFYLTMKNPNIKMCPKQNCQGLLQTTAKTIMICNTCEYTCCAKCLLAVHEGECDTHQVMFFQSNLHYRQCKRCKFIIEKNQGCNHMTCRCGNQFCYVCGQDWTPAHYGNHDENGHLIPVPENQAVHQDNDTCCDCGCMDDCCGQCCAGVLKVPLKFIIMLLYIALMLLIFISRDLMVLTGVSIVTLLAGMFGFSVMLISDLEGFMCVLAIIFFPITMIVGVVMASQEIFCSVIPDMCSDYWQMFCSGASSICQI